MTQNNTATPPATAAPLPARSVPDLLLARAESSPSTMALIVDGDGPLTFADWAADSGRVAAALVEAGIRPADRVALLFRAGEWREYATAYLGALRAGATTLHLNDRVPEDEIRRRLALCDVGTVLHSDGVREPHWFTGRGLSCAQAIAGAGSLPAGEILPSAVSDIMFTSGTTGAPKAYLVTHDNLTFGRDPSTLRDFQGGGFMLVPMTLGTSTSATSLIAALTAPAVSLMCDPDDVERMAELIEQFAVRTLAITPWIATRMVEAALHERHDLSSVMVIASGSAPLPPPTAQALLAMMPQAKVMSAYSQSEAGPALVTNVFDPARPLSVGRPTPTTELRLVDDRGADVPVGTVGEIWLRHRAPRRLYLDESRNAGIRSDGFYRTGDFGRLGEDGNLYFVDRGEDLVRVAGDIVSSVAIEAALAEHPSVREVAVVQDAVSGDVAAYVVLRPGGDAEALQRFAVERLPELVLPLRIRLRERLPRSQTGKVLKRVLRNHEGGG